MCYKFYLTLSRREKMPEIIKIYVKYWKSITGAICGLFLWLYSLGNNNDQNWLLIQYPWGNVKVIDSPGWFSSPTTVEGKRKFHQLFGGSEAAVEAAVWAHLSDAVN